MLTPAGLVNLLLDYLNGPGAPDLPIFEHLQRTNSTSVSKTFS